MTNAMNVTTTKEQIKTTLAKQYIELLEAAREMAEMGNREAFFNKEQQAKGVALSASALGITTDQFMNKVRAMKVVGMAV